MTPRLVAVLVMIGLVMLGMGPYLWVLDELPQSRDAVMWITNGDPGSEGFWRWTFSTAHFRVGYRPWLGLSYTLTFLLGGFEPHAHRLFDVVAHGACIALTAAVTYRFRAPGTRAGVLGVHLLGPPVAAAVVAFHPVGAYVVPHLARRGYALVSCMVLLALLAVPRGEGGRGGWAVAIVVAALAALTHEAGFVAFGLLVVASWAHDPRAWRARLPAWGVVGAVAAALVGGRALVMQGLGGYRSAPASMVDVSVATLTSLIPAGGVRMDGEAVHTLGLGVAGLVVVGLLLGAAQDRGRSPAMVLGAAWLGALGLLFVPQGVWFLRQTYLMVPALGLLVGALVAAGRRCSGVGWIALGVVVLRSGLWTGGAPDVRAAWERGTQISRDLVQAVGELPRQGRVGAVVPYVTRPMPHAHRARTDEERGGVPHSAKVHAMWAQRQHGRPLRVKAVILAEATAVRPWVEVVSGSAITLRAQGSHIVGVGPERADTADGVWIDEGSSDWLLVHDGARAHVLATAPGRAE